MREIPHKHLSLPQPTAFERVLAYISPKRAANSYRTRCAFAMAESYSGASRSRRSVAGWSVSSGDADVDILGPLQELRERSRDLERNNTIAGAAISTKVTAVVGTGLKLQARPDRKVLGLSDDYADAWEDRAEAEFSLFCQTCDVERTLNFAALQDLAFRSVLTSGDTLVLTPYRVDPGDAYGLKIQLIEADRVCNKDNAADSAEIAGGVIRKNGVPTGYTVQRSHPGSMINRKLEWDTVGAWGKDGRRNAWLLFHKLRIGQYRGLPDLAPVIESLKQLGRYQDAELMAAVVASLFTVFIKTPEGSGLSMNDISEETGGKTTDKDFKLGNGLILDLAEGEDVVTANPGRPNTAFEGFVNAVTTEIGARLELPFEVLTKRFQSSYSAARAALLEAWRYFHGRRKWLADNFCQPIYELFLTEAVASGRIIAPGYLSNEPLFKAAWSRAEWVGDAPGHIDEGKAAEAAVKRINGGLSNEAIEVTALTGRDRDQVYQGRKKEIAQRKADEMMPADLQLVPSVEQVEKP
jgi:lambda family phage portal protein